MPLLPALERVSETLSVCSTCGNVDTSDPCTVCADPRRDTRLLCVVEEVADLWALDRSRLFPGRYHVLGGRLSALEGVRPEDLAIDSLVRRVVHRVEHVGDQRAHPVVDLLDRRGDLAQARVRDLDNGQYGHGLYLVAVDRRFKQLPRRAERAIQEMGRRARRAWASVPSSR